MNKNSLQPISVQIRLNSTIEKVWRFWTKPEHIVNWNFASDEWCCPKVENDLRAGGRFSYRMEAKDGSMGFDFWGDYTEIIENKLITYKLGDNRLVKIEFEENENEILLTESFEPEGTNADEMQRAGWQAILGNFKKYLEESEG